MFQAGSWGFETPLYTWSGGDITANWGFWEKIMYGRMIFPTTNEDYPFSYYFFAIKETHCNCYKGIKFDLVASNKTNGVVMIKPDHAREEAGTRKGFCITERATAYST